MNHYKNNLLEELHRLTEAVQASHADIAPTYLEYTQLAFAIATDCGEAGRADFMSLCSLSPKHDSAAAEKLFSNALHTCKGDIHLGSVFHLAEMCGVRVAPSHKNADADAADAGPFFSHTCARYNKVENEEKETGKKKHEEEEKEMKGTEPLSPLPYFPQDHDWPEPLKSILSFAKTPAQHDVLLLGAMTVLGASLSHIVRCKVRGQMAVSLPADLHHGPCRRREECTGMGTQTHRAHTRGNTPAGGGEHESLPQGAKSLRSAGEGTQGQGAARGAAQPHVHHPRQQHGHGTAAKPDRLGRNGDYLRERGGHRIDSHRDGIRQLERHAAQGVRPRPPVLQPPHRPGIQGNHRLLPVRTPLGHARTDKAAHLLAGERTVLAKHILLHAPCRRMERPVRRR